MPMNNNYDSNNINNNDNKDTNNNDNNSGKNSNTTEQNNIPAQLSVFTMVCFRLEPAVL